MANEKTVISIEVNGVERAITSLKDFKQAKKDLTEASILGDKKAAKSLADLKDKMEDLTDATKTLKGSGVEKISSSFSLLGQGFKDFDFDKIKTGFKGVGSAMKAIPIFLIIEGISYLIEHWEELSKGNGLIAKSLQFLGGIFTSIIDTIYAFTDAIGLTNSELDKQGESIKGFADKSNAALAEQSAGFDRQIAVAKASGKSTVELEKAKQQAIIDTNYIIAKQIEAFVRAGGELDDEKRKQLTASLDLIKNAKVKEYEITQADNTVKKEQYKKHLEELAEIKRQNDFDQKEIDKQVAKNKKSTNDEFAKEADLELKTKLDNAEIIGQELMGIDEKYNQINNENLRAWNDKNKAERQKQIQDDLALSKSALESTQALSDIFFANKLSKVKKGSAEETAIAKKQFEVNKALQIAQAVMQGAQAVLAAYASGSAIPIIGAVAGPLYAVAAGLVAIKNIQTIKNAQFGGGSPSAPDTNAGNVSIPSNGTPNIAPPTSQQPSTTFTGNKNDQFQPVKAFVTETDIRHSSKRIDTLQSQATY